LHRILLLLVEEVSADASVDVKGEVRVKDLLDRSGKWCLWVQKSELVRSTRGIGVFSRDNVHGAPIYSIPFAIGGCNLGAGIQDVAADVGGNNEASDGGFWVNDGNRVIEI